MTFNKNMKRNCPKIIKKTTPNYQCHKRHFIGNVIFNNLSQIVLKQLNVAKKGDQMTSLMSAQLIIPKYGNFIVLLQERLSILRGNCNMVLQYSTRRRKIKLSDDLGKWFMGFNHRRSDWFFFQNTVQLWGGGLGKIVRFIFKSGKGGCSRWS